MKPPPQRRRWLRLAVLFVMVYGGVTMGARSISDSMIFVPDYGSRVEPPGAFRIRVDETIWVSAVYLPNPAARFTLWYFHGNAEALGDLEPRLTQLRDSGFAVLAVEYPGYGVSPGTPREDTIYAANRAALQHVRDELRIPLDRVLLYGRSVGGGPAVELAANESFAGLVLESAFVSAFRVLTRWPLLPGDKFKNLKKLPRVRCPVLVMHGRHDRVIPFWHGERLHAAVRGPRQKFWVDGAGHNDLLEVADETYWAALSDFVALIEQQQPRD